MRINEPIENAELMKECVSNIIIHLREYFPDFIFHYNGKQLAKLTAKITEEIRTYSNHRVILVFKAALEAMELLAKK